MNPFRESSNGTQARNQIKVRENALRGGRGRDGGDTSSIIGCIPPIYKSVRLICTLRFPDAHKEEPEYPTRIYLSDDLRAHYRIPVVHIASSRIADRAAAATDTHFLALWLDHHPEYTDTYNVEHGNGTQYNFRVSRTLQSVQGTLKAVSTSMSLKRAKAQADFGIMYAMTLDQSKKNDRLQFQMEATNISNMVGSPQSSAQAHNTIITNDESMVRSDALVPTSSIDYASSEPISSFPTLTDRWIPLSSIRIDGSQQPGSMVAVYFLPESIIEESIKSINLLPFRAHIYSELDIEMKFVVNANKFQCGMLIASVKFDSYEADDIFNSTQAALCRPHVMLDLATNNEGVLSVPFRYHRALLRNALNLDSSIGVRPQKYASIYLQVLAPLRTGPDSPTDLYIRPFARFSKARFTATSYDDQLALSTTSAQMDTGCVIEDVSEGIQCMALEPSVTDQRTSLSLQMDTIGSIANALEEVAPTPGLKRMISGAEMTTRGIGKILNLDKPTMLESSIFIPRARMNFCTGKGTIDTLPLRNDPTTVTSYSAIQPYADDPKTTLQLASIWGLRGVGQWTTADADNTLLADLVMDPTCRFSDYNGQITPLEYACSMYKFWSGTIEIRVDFCSNAFHSGSVMLVAEYGRIGNSASSIREGQAPSSYTKTFHLGTQKSVTFTVPYLYDTVMRRSNGQSYDPYMYRTFPAAGIPYRLDVVTPVTTRFSIYVINPLRPIESVSSTLDFLVYWRASPSFYLHSLCQSSLQIAQSNYYDATQNLGLIDNFPQLYAADQVSTLTTPDVTNVKTSRASGFVPGSHLHKKNNKSSVVRDLKRQTKFGELTRASLIKQSNRDVYSNSKKDKPTGQMDNGTKEDTDTTADFSIGRSSYGLQTNDSHISIKDIIRRPTLMLWRTAIPANTDGTQFFIPLMPPTFNMDFYSAKSDVPNQQIFSTQIAKTPAGMLLSLFRFWRGSMRYTIFVNNMDSPSEPLYVTHVPHTGSRIIGPFQVGQYAQADAPICGSGLTTEVIVPVVNPSAVIEVPYDTENNWTLMFESQANRDYSWRDKGDTCAGHLVLSSAVATNVTVFWSAGDDFEFSNFYGVPYVAQFTSQYLTDNRGIYQGGSVTLAAASKDTKAADTLPRDTSTSTTTAATTSTGQMDEGELIAQMDQGENMDFQSNCDQAERRDGGETISVFPEIFSGITNKITKPYTDTIKRVNQLVEKSESFVNNDLPNLCTKTDKVLTDVAVTLEQVQDALLKVFSGIETAGSFASIAVDLIVDLAYAIYKNCYDILAATLTRIVLRLFGVNTIQASMLKYVRQIADSITGFMTKPKLELQMDKVVLTSVVTATAGLLGMITKTHYTVAGKENVFDSIYAMAMRSDTLSYFNLMMRFIRTWVDLVVGFLDEKFYADPHAKILKTLAEDSEYLNEFITNARLYMSEENRSIRNNIAYKTKFHNIYMKACNIQKAIILCGKNPGAQPLHTLCTEYIKWYNEKHSTFTSVSHRPRPFLLWMDGPAGTGKTTLAKHVVPVILNAVGQGKGENATYFERNLCSAFWDDYTGQKVFLINDPAFSQDRAQNLLFAGELQHLASCEKFVVPMASLEEKGRRAAPLAIVMTTNPCVLSNVEQLLVDATSFRRRPTLRVRCVFAPGHNSKTVYELTENDDEFKHMRFFTYKDQMNIRADDYNNFNEKDPLTYNELKKIIEEKAQTHLKKEFAAVRKNIIKAQVEQYGKKPEEVVVEDPFLTYEEQELTVDPQNNEEFLLPSQILDQSIKSYSNILDSKLRTLNRPPEVAKTVCPSQVITDNATCVDSCSTFTGLSIVAKIGRRARQRQNRRKGSVSSTQTITQERVTNEELKLQMDCPTTLKSLFEEGKRVLGRALPDSFKCDACGSRLALYKMCVNKHVFCQECNITDECSTCLEPTYTGTSEWFAYLLKLNQWTKKQGDLANEKLTLLTNRLKDVGTDLNMWLHPTPTIPKDGIDLSVDSSFIKIAHGFGPFELYGDVYISREKLREMALKTRHVTSSCQHNYLLTHVNHAKYCGGKWQVYMPDGDRFRVEEVPDGPCRGNCYLNEDNYMEFLRAWVNNNLTQIQQARFDYLMGKIELQEPVVITPTWVKPPISFGKQFWNFLDESVFPYITQYRTLIAIGAGLASVVTIGSLFLGSSGDQSVVSQGGAAIGHYTDTSSAERKEDRREYTPRFEYQNFKNHYHRAYCQGETGTLVQPVPVVAEVSSDPLKEEENDAFASIMRKIARNQIDLIMITGNERRVCSTLAVCGRYVIMNKHYYDYMNLHRDKLHVTLAPTMWTITDEKGNKVNHRTHEYTFDASDFTIFSNSDLACLKLPASFGLYSDIRGFFATDKDFSGVMNADAMLQSVRHGVIERNSIRIHGFKPVVRASYAEIGEFDIRNAIAYNFSRSGACGSVLMSKSQARPILGLHAAGYSSSPPMGYAIAVTQEMIAKLVPQNDLMLQGPLPENILPFGETEEKPVLLYTSTNVEYLGVVSKKDTVHLPTKSNISPSAVHKVDGLTPVNYPCILSPTDPRYTHDATPLVHGVAKHGKLTRDFSSSQIRRARDALYTRWYLPMKPLVVPCKRLTYAEAVRGFEVLDFYDPMKLNTSAGYPYVTKSIDKSKKAWIEVVDDTVRLEPSLLKTLRIKEEQRKNGIVPATLFTDTLKDERKREEKLMKIGGTRIFCASPVDHTISVRQNLLHFIAAMNANRLKVQSGIGLNGNGPEWTSLVSYLYEVSDNIITIDYANFGPGYQAGVAEAAATIMAEWTGVHVEDVNVLEIKTLLQECINSMHIARNTVYQQFCGSPSGAAMTTNINSLVNQLYILIAWEALCGDLASEEYLDIFEVFATHVRMVVYGDDLIMSVSDKYIEHFNTLTIQAYFAQYGIVATGAEKTDDVVAYRPLTECTFLKRGFRLHDDRPGFWLAPALKDSIEDITQWIPKSGERLDNTRVNCEAALRAAHAHGRAYFYDLRSRLNSAFVKVGITPLTMTWEQVDKLWFTDLSLYHGDLAEPGFWLPAVNEGVTLPLPKGSTYALPEPYTTRNYSSATDNLSYLTKDSNSARNKSVEGQGCTSSKLQNQNKNVMGTQLFSTHAAPAQGTRRLRYLPASTTGVYETRSSHKNPKIIQNQLSFEYDSPLNHVSQPRTGHPEDSSNDGYDKNKTFACYEDTSTESLPTPFTSYLGCGGPGETVCMGIL